MRQGWLQFAMLACVVVVACPLAGCIGVETRTTIPPPATATTIDTANYADSLRAQHPTEESFTNDNCSEVFHGYFDPQEGAAVDVVAQVSQGPDETEDHWLKWQIWVPWSGQLYFGEWVLCLTNLPVDASLLQQRAWIRVRGVVLRRPELEDLTSPYEHSHLVVYAETVELSPQPTTTTLRKPATTTDSFDYEDPVRCLDCGYEWIEDYQRAVDDWYEFGEGEYADDEPYYDGEVPEWWFEDWAPRCPECGSDNVQIDR